MGRAPDNLCLMAKFFRRILIACVACFGLLSAGVLIEAAFAEWSPAKVTLPIEVMGEDGTEASVTFDVPREIGGHICSLWLQIHGLEYADMASIRLNQGAWISLTNQTASVAEPGKSYGGIGGGFATLKLTVALSDGSVTGGPNTLHFRFNHSNGVASGFRVLAFNLLTADGRAVLPPGTFIAEDPGRWAAPLTAREDILEGERWWRSATLKASNQGGAQAIRAHCSDCHAQDGRDLKYFNYSNHSIIVRSQFHGLSERQGEQIASYIRSLPFANPGRPWNPPYQPGPGLEAKPAADWAAGAGLEWALDHDAETLPYLFPAQGRLQGMAITPAAFAPEGHLHEREIPISLQLPDWNHWLPQVHPLDAWGDRFAGSEFARLYATSDFARVGSAEAFRDFFDRWLRSRRHFLNPPSVASKQWTPGMSRDLYSTLLWQLVKTWEITQRFGLEAGGAQKVGSDCVRQSWLNTIPAETAPATVSIPDGLNGMSGSGLTNEYFDNAWYALQIVLNSGDHQHRGRGPVDWVYIAGRARELERWSGRPEPARLILIGIKAMQSTDPALGPQNLAEGWRPEQNIDPRMLVAPAWSPTFAALPALERQEIAQSWLAAWLEKCSRYPTAAYFYRGQVPGSYAPPKALHEISGGRVWEAAADFRRAGVDAGLVHRLEVWGAAYSVGAGLFHY
jgi:cytochrome c553